MDKYIFTTICLLWALHPLASLPLVAKQDVTLSTPKTTEILPTTSFKISRAGYTFTPNEKCLYVTTHKEKASLPTSPFIFTDIKDALSAVKEGTEDHPMRVMIAPSVYWLDNPEDPAIRRPQDKSGTPYAITVDCPYLHLIGLSDRPEEVILAVNRGQTQGAVGNFTMMLLKGDGLRAENITFGNYCNVDLVYPSNPGLNRKKRSNAIVQAQLVHCAGSDKVFVRNCRFISRLNLCPFVGARRTLFDNCYFECTDDALSGSAVYYRCRFTLFSSKPFYGTTSTGAVFLDCDLYTHTRDQQYLTKVPGVVSMIDCRWHTLYDAAHAPLQISWTRDASSTVCYQHNVTLNGAPYIIDKDRPEGNILLSDQSILKAYKLTHQGKVIYNLCNLLGADDGWDPLDQRPLLSQIEASSRQSLTRIPTLLSLTPSHLNMEAQGQTEILESRYYLWGAFPASRESHEMLTKGYNQWEASGVLKIQPRDFNTAFCTSQSHFYTPTDATVTMAADCGLHARAMIRLKPHLKAAPQFASPPTLSYEKKRRAITLSYTITPGNEDDCSRVVWYRLTDPEQMDTIAVKYGTESAERTIYPISRADRDYYLMAAITPRRRDTHFGETQYVIMQHPISDKQVKWDLFDQHSLHTDFTDIPCHYQPHIRPGFWTFDAHKPADTHEYDWTPNPQNAWRYGTAPDNAQGKGLVQQSRGARLFYTPARRGCGDMRVRWIMDPCKSGGQGFGSATGQYLDLYIKMDAKTLTGYGLRIERTPHHDRAVTFTLMRYDHGHATPISPPRPSACFRTSCTVELTLRGHYLTAMAVTSAPISHETLPSDVATSISLRAEVEPGDGTSIGLQHTGSVGASATLIHHVEAEWKTF